MHHVNLNVAVRLLFSNVRNGGLTINILRFGFIRIQENPHLEMSSGTLA